MEINNKNCLVVGLGISGMATARFLKHRGASVTVTDMAESHKLGNYPSILGEMGITLELGQHRMETFEQADMIVLSPGVSHTILPVKKAKEKGASILGEIELASLFIHKPIAAVTGTNGKTTTTTLLGKMLAHSGFKVFVGGNIGNPLIDYVDRGENADVIVAEISSFQLDTIETFNPKVAVLLNITDDHLDRYPNFDAYIQSKARIFENQGKNDTAVLFGSDPAVRSIFKQIKSRKLIYDTILNLPLESGEGAILTKDRIELNLREAMNQSIDMSLTNLSGRHNMENIAAASLAALAAGGTYEGIISALKQFKGLPHRIEYVTAINGVKYYDDSKGTNVDAVVRALEVFSEPVILIMGGRDKGSNYGLLEKSVRQRVKKLILLGESKEIIKSALGHITSTEMASTMEDAVFRAYQAASPGDVVLLSPACSSFDMYRNYAERGKMFCQAVSQLGSVK